MFPPTPPSDAECFPDRKKDWFHFGTFSRISKTTTCSFSFPNASRADFAQIIFPVPKSFLGPRRILPFFLPSGRLRPFTIEVQFALFCPLRSLNYKPFPPRLRRRRGAVNLGSRPLSLPLFLPSTFFNQEPLALPLLYPKSLQTRTVLSSFGVEVRGLFPPSAELCGQLYLLSVSLVDDSQKGRTGHFLRPSFSFQWIRTHEFWPLVYCRLLA